jgi:prolyl 4-hydroxylase
MLLFTIALYYIIPVTYENNQTLAFANNTDPYDKPRILNDVLTPDQCIAIINNAREKLFDSEVIGGKHPGRNSMQCWIPKTDQLIKPLFDAMSQKFGISYENAEDLQVVRYLPNQYYNEHHDSCCDDNDKCREFVGRGGQRKLTILIYLNNEFEGGYTYFKNIDLKVKPKTGDAVVFHPLAINSNKCHPLALHAGLPVTRGEKWVANVWFREKKFV